MPSLLKCGEVGKHLGETFANFHTFYQMARYHTTLVRACGITFQLKTIWSGKTFLTAVRNIFPDHVQTVWWYFWYFDDIMMIFDFADICYQPLWQLLLPWSLANLCVCCPIEFNVKKIMWHWQLALTERRFVQLASVQFSSSKKKTTQVHIIYSIYYERGRRPREFYWE